MDGQHRRAHAHAGDLRVESAFQRGEVMSGKMRDIGGGAAHVKTDDAIAAGIQRRAHRADDAACGAGEDAVLAAELIGVGQAAAGLHEQQSGPRQFFFDLVDVTPQHRCQIGIDHGGIAACHQFHQRADFVGHRNLCKSTFNGQGGGELFMPRITVAVHENDGDRAIALSLCGLKVTAQCRSIRSADDVAVRTDAFIDFPDRAVEQIRQHDMAVKDAWAVLPGDAQRVAETAGDEQCGAFAAALKQGIGRHRGAHAHGIDLSCRDGGIAGQAHQVADAGQSGIAVTRGILRQQFVRDQAAVGAARDDVGEGAATVDPELPAQAGCVSCSHAGFVVGLRQHVSALAG